MSSNESSYSSRLRKFLLKLLFWRRSKESSLRDTIEELIEEDGCSETQSIEENEREILGNVLNLRDIQVQDIMVPRVEIEAVPATTRIEILLSRFLQEQTGLIHYMKMKGQIIIMKRGNMQKLI